MSICLSESCGNKLPVGLLLEGIEWKPGKIYPGGFVEVQVPGLGPVQRKVPIERPTKRGS